MPSVAVRLKPRIILECGVGSDIQLRAAFPLLHDGCSRVHADVQKWFAEEAAGTEDHIALHVENIRRAATPMGHIGGRLRWHKTLLKLLNKEFVHIAVVGGSMTAGHGSSSSWVELFANASQERGYNVMVTNLAMPAANSMVFVNSWKRKVKSKLATRPEVDLFIIDFSVNDNLLLSEMQSLLVAFPRLLSTLTNFHNASLLNLETFSLDSTGRKLSGCATKHNSMHWPILKEFGVPTVSYPEAVCDAWNQTFWHLTPGKPMAHPNITTHKLIARVMMDVFYLEMQHVCEHGIGRGEVAAPSTNVFLSASEKCLSEPETDLDAMDGEARFVPADRNASVWQFFEDHPNKPGWIATGEGVSGDISFGINTRQGYIQMGVLGTYEHIGDVVCWLDSVDPHRGNSCRMSGLVAERVSTPQFMSMRATSGGHHLLRCRSDGRKFKILSLKAC